MRIPQELMEAAIRDYVENGMSGRKAADKYGISQRQVLFRLHERGLTRTHTQSASMRYKYTEEQKMEAALAVIDGMTYTEAEKQFGMTHPTIRRKVRELVPVEVEVEVEVEEMPPEYWEIG